LSGSDEGMVAYLIENFRSESLGVMIIGSSLDFSGAGERDGRV